MDSRRLGGTAEVPPLRSLPFRTPLEADMTCLDFAKSPRTRALIHLVGNTRAYREQVGLAISELEELRDRDLDGVAELLNQTEDHLAKLNDLATRKLRES